MGYKNKNLIAILYSVGVSNVFYFLLNIFLKMLNYKNCKQNVTNKLSNS